MPQSREYARNRRQSTRIASESVRRALRDLRPSHVRAARRAVTESSGRERDNLAYASNPITFTVDEKGKLLTRKPRATARHEVGHFVIAEAQHGAMMGHVAMSSVDRFQGPSGATPLSRRGLRSLKLEANLPSSRRIQHRIRGRRSGVR